MNGMGKNLQNEYVLDQGREEALALFEKRRNQTRDVMQAADDFCGSGLRK